MIFAHAIRRRIRIVEGLRGENHAEFLEEPLQHLASIGESGEFDGIAVDVEDRGFFPGDYQLLEMAQLGRFAAEEQNELVFPVQGAVVDNRA